MNTMDNAKVMETLEKHAMHNYVEKLLGSKVSKLTLFSILPFTAAANLSDPRHFFMINDPAKMVTLNSGNYQN